MLTYQHPLPQHLPRYYLCPVLPMCCARQGDPGWCGMGGVGHLTRGEQFYFHSMGNTQRGPARTFLCSLCVHRIDSIVPPRESGERCMFAHCVYFALPFYLHWGPLTVVLDRRPLRYDYFYEQHVSLVPLQHHYRTTHARPLIRRVR